MSFNFLSFIACRSEVVYDFEHCFCQPFRRYLPPVIELEGE